MKRIALNLDDDLCRVVKRYAEGGSLSVGEALVELVRKGLSAPPPTRTVHGIQIFDVPADSPRITTERVKELESCSPMRKEYRG